ncbi:amidophosphoribosyltransferase, partial [Patescibacteria group bacterium]|nr:amidophosphoribosyltransferase [Patescibacteria group bacterium]
VSFKNDIIALSHNGNLPNTTSLRKFLSALGIYTNGHNDSELMYMLIKYYLVKKYPLEKAILEALPLFTGAYCLLIMTKDKLVAIRDPFGIRPLSIGKLDNGYVVSSETCAMDTINAKFIRDINPGEMVVIDKNGLKSHTFASSQEKLDIFEFIYFARPDSVLLGKRVYEVRKNLGRELAKEYPVKADVVIPVPDSSIPAAIGYANELGIPFEFGLVKNRYIGRTFIMPEQHLRETAVQMKLNPIKEIFKGKRVVLIDDSIVRGTTLKKLVEMVRRAGAKEIHLLSSCPPVKFPDFYGIDTPNQKNLIASRMTTAQIKKYMNATSLHYLSYDKMIKATGLPENTFCTSCFNGDYPIDIGANARLVKGIKNKGQNTFLNGRTEHIAVLISDKGTGSNLKAIIEAKRDGKISSTIDLVVSDKKGALGLKHAEENNVPQVVKLLKKSRSRDYYGKELGELLNKKGITIAVMAGFATILPPSFFNVFKGVTVNIHPGLIPDEKNKAFLFPDGTKAPWNQGLITDDAVANFLNKKYAGSTIHLATQEADFGPVLVRKIIPTKPNDTVETLYSRLKKAEHIGLIQSLKKITEKSL